MKFDFRITTTDILIVVVCILLYIFFYHPAVPPAPVITNQYFYDSAVKSIPQPITISPIINIPAQVPINLTAKDSDNIVRDYYTKHFDQRMFSDSNIDITASDSLYRNAIMFSSLQYKWKKPILQKETIQLPYNPVNKLFVGAFADYSLGKTGLGLHFSLMNKKENLLGVGKDFINNQWMVSYDVKLSLRKKVPVLH